MLCAALLPSSPDIADSLLPREQGFRPKARGWVALRSLMLTFQWVAYYAALPTIDLSVAGATFYTLPLFITLFAACVLGSTFARWAGSPSDWASPVY
ncbi:hypothetical protein [Aliamphritea spongicola]|nr:hypothetical protein [Aliamphritea spongicola]